MEKTKKTLDLTSGPILPLMLRFCVPLLLGNLMQQFYNMADAAVVGHFVGTEALAAVGATGAITFLIIGFVNGMCAGFCIPVAQAFGAGDESQLRRCVMNITWLGVIFGAVLTVGTSVFLDWLLTAMDFPADIFADSHIYLRVIFLSIPLTVAYNVLSGLMQSMGNSRTPLVILVISGLTNVVLDLVTVCLWNWAVFGAAIATVAAKLLSVSVALVYLVKNYPVLKTTPEERRFDGKIAFRLTMSGLPMALQYSITAIGSVLIQTAVNGLGSLIVASVTAANKVQSFVHMPFSTLGVTISTWCGQNMGAKKYRRIVDGCRTGMWVALIYSVGMGFVMYFGGEYISLIFLDSGDAQISELLTYLRQFLRGNCIFYIPLGVLTVCRFALQGMEHGVTAMFAGFFEMFARGIVALVFAKTFGYGAIIYANPAAWFAACVLLVPACLVVFPKVRRMLEAQQTEGRTEPTDSLPETAHHA